MHTVLILSLKKDHLEQHVRSVHDKIKEICETCGKSFSDKSHLNRHKTKKHSETLQTKRKANDTLETPSKIIKIVDDENIDDGEMVVDGDENMNDFKCSLCNNQFKELKNLNKHIKKCASGENLKCAICSYKTNDTLSIQRHTEGCMKRKREEDVGEYDTNSTRDEHSTNEAPIEDEASDNIKSCFNGTLQTKIWKGH